MQLWWSVRKRWGQTFYCAAELSFSAVFSVSFRRARVREVSIKLVLIVEAGHKYLSGP